MNRPKLYPKRTRRPAIVIQVGSADPSSGERMIVSRNAVTTPIGKTIVIEFHFRDRERERQEPHMGRCAYRVAFFEIDDDEAASLRDALSDVLALPAPAHAEEP